MTFVNFINKFNPGFYSSLLEHREDFENLLARVQNYSSIAELILLRTDLKAEIERLESKFEEEDRLYQKYIALEGLDLAQSEEAQPFYNIYKCYDLMLKMVYIYKAERFIEGYLKFPVMQGGKCMMSEPTCKLIKDTAEQGFSEVGLTRLGKGNFGFVDEVIVGDSSYARKCITRHIQEDINNELRILSKLNHPSIIQLVGIRPSKGKSDEFYLEKADRSMDALERDENLTVEELRGYLRDVMEGLVYLEEKKLVHYDIKPANLLIVNGKAKIADFDMLEPIGRRYERGSNAYRAPETFWSTYCCLIDQDTGVDIWSYGVSIYKILSGGKFHLPIKNLAQLKAKYRTQHLTADEVLRKLENDNAERVEKLDPTGDLRRLMMQCLTFKSKDRPKATALIRHPYFQGGR